MAAVRASYIRAFRAGKDPRASGRYACRIVRQSNFTRRKVMVFFPKLNNRNCGKILTVTSMKTQIAIEGLHTMMKRKVLWALLAAGMAVVLTGVASAQSTTALPTVGLLGVLTKKSLVGSWVETVTFDNGRPPLKSLVSFHADGTMMSSDQGSVTLGPTPTRGIQLRSWCSDPTGLAYFRIYG